MKTDIRYPENLTDGVELLQQELTRRISENPRYSLRAFAKTLSMSPATLSLVLSRKVGLSKRSIEKITKVIPLGPRQLDRLHEKRASKERKLEGQTSNVTMEIFTVLSEWYHFAILSLLEVLGSPIDHGWISKKLGITLTEAKLAVARLKKLKLIAEVDGHWRQVCEPMRIGNILSNAAARKFQKQLIEKALASLENDPTELRDITSMTFAMDPKELTYASEKITKFRRSLTKALESRGQPKAVYSLTVQLFPMTRSNT